MARSRLHPPRAPRPGQWCQHHHGPGPVTPDL